MKSLGKAEPISNLPLPPLFEGFSWFGFLIGFQGNHLYIYGTYKKTI
jgi:hypothetical protein